LNVLVLKAKQQQQQNMLCLGLGKRKIYEYVEINPFTLSFKKVTSSKKQ
jgi:hypothetical protein